jgi:hypothetical protein
MALLWSTKFRSLAAMTFVSCSLCTRHRARGEDGSARLFHVRPPMVAWMPSATNCHSAPLSTDTCTRTVWLVAAPAARQFKSTCPEATPPRLKVSTYKAALVGDFEACAVPPNGPMLIRPPFSPSGSLVQAVLPGQPASISGEVTGS